MGDQAERVAVLVLGYVRVSTIEQEQGFGPEVQEEAIRAHCKTNGLDEPEIICESKSGESLLDREEIKEVLMRAEEAQAAGNAAHVVFYRLDRLSRDLIDQEVTVGKAMRTGFRLHSTFASEQDTLNPAFMGDPTRTLIRQVFGIFNQFEKANIQLRLDGGLRAKGKKGGSTGGRMAFGYWASNQDITVHPQEAPAVRRCFALVGQGIDLASVAVILGREFPDHCAHWQKSYVSRVIDRKDLYVFGRYRPRGADKATVRPELVIVQPTEYERAVQGDGSWAEPETKASGEIVWGNVPDPVPVSTLAVLLDRTQDQVRNRAVVMAVPVLWEKGKAKIPKVYAIKMAEHIAQMG